MSELKPGDKVENQDLTLPIARKGEQQYGVLARQRSGIDSGVITPVSRTFAIKELCDGDQRDICMAALKLAEMVLSACDEKNRSDLSHWANRIQKLCSIHCDPTDELERLRAYVELQPCFCGGWIKLCSRCEALGKDKS